MKILLTISSLDSGGAERVLTQIANHQAEVRQHDVHILILRPKGIESFYPLSSKITVHYMGSFKSPDPFLPKVILYKTKMLFKIRHTINMIAPDRLISFIELMNLVVLLATFNLKIKGKSFPIIVCERSDPFQFKIGFMLNHLRHLLYLFTHKIILQRDSVKSYFSKRIQRKCLTIPNAIPPFHLDNPPPKENLILSIGRMDQGKDHITLLKAFASLAKDYPQWSLEIYGEGVLRPDLERYIQENNLDKQIHLPGTTQDVPHHLARANIFAFPTLYEGFSNALGEAMAAGLPVVASNCAGNKALVDHNKTGLLFPIQDIEALSAALKSLMDDPEKRTSLGQAAQGRMKDFHPDGIMAQWDALLQQTIKSSQN
jgi:glycosyltransferase involved in cell wall biosynthesis